MTQKKQPVEILCSSCGTGFRLWVPPGTVQEWGDEGTRISCVGCGAQYTVKQGKKGLEARPATPATPPTPAGQAGPVGAATAAEPVQQHAQPLQQAQASPPSQETVGRPPASEQPAVEKETVLLIDDDKLAREMVRNTLKDVGIRLVTAQNSAEALKFIKSEDVDLIVTDLYLKGPGDPETLVDGEELLKKIHDMGMAIPAIITTGKDIIDDLVLDPKWFDLRVKGFIQKGNPFWAEELKLKIKEVMYKD
ncbi:MAG: response regulator [Thermodesulfobacteriota bacterium]